MLADRPEGVDQVLPVYLWAGIAALAVMAVVLAAGYWGMFGPPRWATFRPVRKRLYRGSRRVDPGNPEQVRPARPVTQLEDDAVQFPCVGEPLAIEAAPRPYRYASRAQHKEPLAEELTW